MEGAGEDWLLALSDMDACSCGPGLPCRGSWIHLDTREGEEPPSFLEGAGAVVAMTCAAISMSPQTLDNASRFDHDG